MAGDFEQYCANIGLRRELTAPYLPQQNGVVERRNQSVVGTAQCMLKAKQLLGVFWGEAVTTAVYLLNRSSSKSIGGKTPYELWTGSAPGVQHLRTFGSIAHMKLTAPNPKKLDDRSRRTIFVGYEAGSKAYRLYDPLARRVHVSRDVVFDEGAKWDWAGEHPAGADDFTVEEGSMEAPEVITGTTSTTPAVGTSTSSSTSPTPSPPSSSAFHDVTPQTPSTPAQAAGQGLEFDTPLGTGEVDLDADHDDAPLRFRRVDNVLGPTSPPGLAHWETSEQLLLASDAEPSTFAEALDHEC